METREPDFFRPVAPQRLKAYIVLFTVVGVVFVGTTIGVGTGLLSPSFTLDVTANLLFGLPVIVLPIVLFWKAAGEQRSRLQLAAELTLIYIPLTVGGQLTYELPFLIGHPFDLWTPTSNPGWRWLWWQYGLADQRYGSHDNWIFGLEFVSVVVGIMLFIVWIRLLRRDLPDESRIRCLWLSFLGIAALLTGTVAYYVAEIRAGFSDIGQGAFGLWFKFVGENVPYMILPAFVLYAIYLQITYLTRWVAVGEFAGSGRIVEAGTQAWSRVPR
jgi:hypothetical protein